MNNTRDLILYVDDEEQALKYFCLAFAQQYEVLTAANAEQAWEVVERESARLAVVISDQRMPGRSGVELLTSIKERCPRAVRLLTTAYTDLTSAIDAVNQGAIFAYISKPWKVEELRMVLRQALAFHRLQVERDALLSEKLSVFQQLLLADRKRAFGLMAAPLVGPVRRPLAAAAAWARDRELYFSDAKKSPGEDRDLWPMMVEQSRSSLHLGQAIGQWLVRNRTGDETIVDLAALLQMSSQGMPGVTATTTRTDAVMPLDRGLLAAGWEDLLRLLAHFTHETGGEISVDVHLADGPPVLSARIRGSGNRGEMVDGIDRLGFAAYLAIHHHAGTIAVTRWDRAGGNLTIQLGVASNRDDEGQEAFITALDRAER